MNSKSINNRHLTHSKDLRKPTLDSLEKIKPLHQPTKLESFDLNIYTKIQKKQNPYIIYKLVQYKIQKPFLIKFFCLILFSITINHKFKK